MGRAEDLFLRIKNGQANEIAKMIAEPFVDHPFEEFEIAKSDPDLEHAQLFQARHEIQRDFDIPLEQKVTRIVRQGNGPREDHPWFDILNGNAKHGSPLLMKVSA